MTIAERLMSENATRAEIDVLAERRKQLERYPATHDDEWTGNELAMCASLLAFDQGDPKHAEFVRDYWPPDFAWGPSRDRRADLVKAAAMLIAEVERLDRIQDRFMAEVDELRESVAIQRRVRLLEEERTKLYTITANLGADLARLEQKIRELRGEP